MKYTIFIITISLTVSVAMGFFLLLPKYQEFTVLRTAISQRRTLLENEHKYAEQLRTEDLRLKERREIVSKLGSALPLGPDIPSLLEFLQETSQATGVSIENVRWEEVTHFVYAERVERHTLGLSFSGSYFAFKNFLSAMESSARLIDIFQVNFSASLEPEGSLSFKIVMRIHSY